MNIPVLCIAIAAVLPILCAGLAKMDGFRERRFDNRNPREWLAKQTGRAARANAAQANSWEALAVFAPGVLAALFLGASMSLLTIVSVAWVALRLVYIGLYVGNQASLRSVVWAVALGLSLSTYVLNLF